VELMLAGRYRLMSWTMTPGIAKSTTVKTSMTLVKIESEAADDRTIEAMPRPMRPRLPGRYRFQSAREVCRAARWISGSRVRENETPKEIGGKREHLTESESDSPTTMALPEHNSWSRHRGHVERIGRCCTPNSRRALRAHHDELTEVEADEDPHDRSSMRAWLRRAFVER